MSPDDLRALAHQLETGLDLIGTLELLDASAMAPEDFDAVKAQVTDKLRAAGIKGTNIAWLGHVLAQLGNTVMQEQFALKTRANVVELRPR